MPRSATTASSSSPRRSDPIYASRPGVSGTDTELQALTCSTLVHGLSNRPDGRSAPGAAGAWLVVSPGAEVGAGASGSTVDKKAWTMDRQARGSSDRGSG